MRGDRDYHPATHGSSSHSAAASARSSGGLSIQELKQMTAMRISQQRTSSSSSSMSSSAPAAAVLAAAPGTMQPQQQQRQPYAHGGAYGQRKQQHSSQQHHPAIPASHGAQQLLHSLPHQQPAPSFGSYAFAEANEGGAFTDAANPSSSSFLSSESDSPFETSMSQSGGVSTEASSSSAMAHRGGFGGGKSSGSTNIIGHHLQQQQQPIVIVTSAPNHAASFDGSIMLRESPSAHSSSSSGGGNPGYSGYSSSVGGGRSISSSSSTSSSASKPYHQPQQQHNHHHHHHHHQQQQGGGRGRRREGAVPQGLTVQELKELTRIRLEREALEASRARNAKALHAPSNPAPHLSSGNFASHAHIGADLSNTSDLSDRDSDTSHTSVKSHLSRGGAGNSQSQWPMLASDGGPLLVQHSGARALDAMHSGIVSANNSSSSSYGGATMVHGHGAGNGAYPYADMEFMTAVSSAPEPVLNTMFSSGVPYLSDDSLTSSSVPNPRNATHHQGASSSSSYTSSSLRDGRAVGDQGYRHSGNDNSYSSSYRAGKLSDSSSSSASISSNSTGGARSSVNFASDGYRSSAAAILSSNAANDLFASDFGGMFSFDQGSSVIMTSQGPLPSGDWSIRSLSSAGDASSVAAPSMGPFDSRDVNGAESASRGSVGASSGEVGETTTFSAPRAAAQGPNSGGRGLLGDAIRHMLSIDTSAPLPPPAVLATNHASMSPLGAASSAHGGVPPPPSVAFTGPSYLVSPKSLRNRPQIAVDCPDKIRRRSVSDSLPFEVAEAVLGTPPGSPASTPTLGAAHRKFLTANPPRSSNGSPKVITTSHSFEGSGDDTSSSAAAAGTVVSSSTGPGPLLRSASGSRTLADALLSGVKDNP